MANSYYVYDIAGTRCALIEAGSPAKAALEAGNRWCMMNGDKMDVFTRRRLSSSTFQMVFDHMDGQRKVRKIR